MIAALFLNPAFLLVGAALISVPIIIHLINRMRFKRIRWAAMEFLLKAAKRTRRRLIIEQLLLLALRCLLILLVLILVSRFVGCGETNIGGKPNLHIVLLDDTPSMQDEWKKDGAKHDCFDVAKNDIIIKKIAKGMAQSKTNDRLVILPLSRLIDQNYDPKDLTFERLNDSQVMAKLTQEVTDLKPSMVHVPMLQGVIKAKGIMGNYADARATLHIIGDFRTKDWGLPHSEALMKELVTMAKNNKEIKIRPIDTAYPERVQGQGGYPPSADNIGIIDVRPSTRVAGKNMPVQFTVAIQNFSGKEFETMLVARDEVRGVDLREVNFNPQNNIKLKPQEITYVTFDYRFNPDAKLIKPGLPYFGHLSLKLTTNLLDQQNDSLLADNIRHVVVEVRDKVPILVVDGNRQDGLQEGKDSYHIRTVLSSVPGSSYQVVLAHELPNAGSDVTKALERPDLNQYPTIFLLDVPTLSPKQVSILENYVKDGGGVAFYMGKNVLPERYNKLLYKDGQGLFPAPLKETYYPPVNEPALEPKGGETEAIRPFQLLIRDEKFADPRMMPIFGAMFDDPKQREPLRGLPIRRYFKIPRNQWKQEPEKVAELATLPNDVTATTYGETVREITQGQASTAIRRNEDFLKYKPRLIEHFDRIESIAKPGSEAKAYHLADALNDLLLDRGDPSAKNPLDLTLLWKDADEKVQALKREIVALREQIRYGDPFIVSRQFGNGKVVAVMSTAGKDWNDWAGGSASSVLYPMFVWELQNYLSSQGGEANLPTGKEFRVALDAEQFKGQRIKMVRHFVKTENEKEGEWKEHGDPQVGEEKGGVIPFVLSKHYKPGLYISKIVDESAPENKAPIAVYAHVFNVDTIHEGNLTRVGSDELKEELEGKGGDIRIVNPSEGSDDLVGRQYDWSESPWLFLVLLLVLVAEQALAVHLSFHLKNTEDEMAPAGARA